MDPSQGLNVMKAKQQRFVTEYLIDLNATQAAIRAGYSPKTVQQQGSRLLTNAVVKQAIAAQHSRQLKAVDVRIEDVLRDVMVIALGEILTSSNRPVTSRYADSCSQR